MINTKKVSVSNILTCSRIAIAPFAYYAGLTGNQELFIILFAIGGFTDFLDGLIARIFSPDSKFGRAFDTFADMIFYPSGLTIYFITPALFEKQGIVIAITTALFAILMTTRYFLGKMTKPHLLPSRILGVFIYFFVIYTALFGYSPQFFYATLAIAIWAAIEQIIFLSSSEKKRKVLL